MLATCARGRLRSSCEDQLVHQEALRIGAAEPDAPADLASCQTVEALRAWLQRFARDLGFYGGRYVHLGHAASGDPMRFLSTSARDVARNDEDESWLDRDPVAAEIRNAFAPFRWSMRANAALTGAQRRWVEGERLRGVCAGIAVPVQDHAAGSAYLSFFGVDDAGAASLLSERAPHLAFYGVQFHVRAREVLPVLEAANRSALTDRERQCLELAAQGRTVPAIAHALEIAARTAEFHLANAAAKLRAANKIHAVALAADKRLILV